jgi:hypothetical protein
MNSAGLRKGQTRKGSKIHLISLCLVFSNEEKLSACLSSIANMEDMATKDGQPMVEYLIEMREKLLDAGMAEDPDFIEQWEVAKYYPNAFVDVLQDLSKQL